MNYFSIPNDTIESYLKGETSFDMLRQKHANGKEENSALLHQFLSIQTNETIVFNGWIESNPVLRDFLLFGEIQQPYVGFGNIQKHILYPNFQQYIGLFFPVFQGEATIGKEIKDYLGFLQVLTDEKRFQVEQNLQTHLRIQLELEGSKCTGISDAKEFNRAVSYFLSDEKVELFLSLSQGSERVKAQWVESTLTLLADPKCTSNTAHYAFQQLSKIELNQILKASLDKAIHRFKGVQVKTQQKKGISRKTKFYARVLLIFLVVGGLIMVLFTKWQDDLETPDNTNASSLKYFSLAERFRVDSLVHSQSETRPMDEDTLGFDNSGINVSVRNAFVNDKAESLYQNLLLGLNDYYLQTNQPTKAKNPARTMHKTEEFSRTGSLQSIQFNNTSGYEVLVIGFENKGGKQVHSRLIKPTEVTTIHVKKNWVFLILPGSGFNQDQTMPFGEINYNYDYSLYAIHTFVAKDKNNKILFKGLAGQEFEMMDQRSIFLDNNE
jgi:hypothetical protein